ncbi:MAG: DUF4367 domain-containing protein, partial [Oscillospiraceae bacterium]
LVWSPKHQRVMDKLYRDPFGTAKKRARPLWKKVLSAAACVLLVCSIALGGLLAFSPSAQAWVQRIIAEWFVTDVTFRFTGDAQPVSGDSWTLGYVTDGFEETETIGTPDDGRISYENSEGLTIIFDYKSVSEGGGFNFDAEHNIYSEITLNGQPAHLFISQRELLPNCLIWFDATGETSFRLMAFVTSEQLLEMAENIEFNPAC